jgi:hypothetical protein
MPWECAKAGATQRTLFMAHLLDDMTPEEHKRRGDAADAMFQEMKRRIAAEDDRSCSSR